MFKKIINFFLSLWHDAKTVINEYASKAYPIVESIKNAVNDPTLATVVGATPIKLDDTILKLAQQWLPKVMESLKLTDAITEATTFDEQLNLLIEFLKTSTPDMQDAIYVKIAALMVKFNIEDDGVGGKFSQSDLDFIVQVGYNKWKEKVEAEVEVEDDGA